MIESGNSSLSLIVRIDHEVEYLSVNVKGIVMFVIRVIFIMVIDRTLITHFLRRVFKVIVGRRR
jgi:hypothetical protein